MRALVVWLSVHVMLSVSVPVLAQQGPVPLHGPAAPVFPEMIARDAAGQATIRTVRAPGPVRLDGRLDESFYRDIAPIGGFLQQEPFEGQPATERTEVWVVFDDEYLYVSARNWESEPGRRVMSDMQRDARNLYNNDHFAVLFDTFYDRRNGYYFYANAQDKMSNNEVINKAPNVRRRRFRTRSVSGACCRPLRETGSHLSTDSRRGDPGRNRLCRRE